MMGMNTSAPGSDPLAPSTTALLRLRLGSMLMLLGAAALTWASPSLDTGLLPVTFVVRCAALAAALAASLGTVWLYQRRVSTASPQPTPLQATPVKHTPRPAPVVHQTETHQTEAHQTEAQRTDIFAPVWFVGAPTPHAPAAAALPVPHPILDALTLPDDWAAHPDGPDVRITRAGLSALRVRLEGEAGEGRSPEGAGEDETLVLWASGPDAPPEPTPSGWRVRGQQAHLNAVLEAL
jgi:hypothetical protein